MIKINLLAEGKRPIISRKAKQPFLQISEPNAANWALGAALALGLLGAAGWFYWLDAEKDRKQNEINVAQREVDELQQVIKEVQEYEAKLKELNRKVDVITTLKDNQRGPVQIMDEVSRALPELLWLNAMQVTANTITFRGSAFNMSAAANFIDNLDRVEAFTEPILRDATRASGRTGGSAARSTDLYNFQLAVNYSFKREPDHDLRQGGPAFAVPGRASVAAGVAMTPRSFVTNIADGASLPSGANADIRGIAFGGDTGVAKVEYSVDDGRTWQLATLGEDHGKYSFRRWQTNLPPLAKGGHSFMARCTNLAGDVQPEAPNWNNSGFMRNVIEPLHITTT